MEYLNGGDLMFHIQEKGRFDVNRATWVCWETMPWVLRRLIPTNVTLSCGHNKTVSLYFFILFSLDSMLQRSYWDFSSSTLNVLSTGKTEHWVLLSMLLHKLGSIFMDFWASWNNLEFFLFSLSISWLAEIWSWTMLCWTRMDTLKSQTLACAERGSLQRTEPAHSVAHQIILRLRLVWWCG